MMNQECCDDVLFIFRLKSAIEAFDYQYAVI
jgi:hypothetical protein